LGICGEGFGKVWGWLEICVPRAGRPMDEMDAEAVILQRIASVFEVFV